MLTLKPVKTFFASSLRIQQQGLSLVELMIAISLGLFLIWGVTQSFLTSRQSYRLQQGVGRVQENGRLAQEFLGYEIRNAGDYGCGSGDDFVWASFDERNDADCATTPGTSGINMITDEDFATNSFEYAVYGFNDDDGADAAITDGTNTVNVSAAPVAESDVLVLRLSEDLGVLDVDIGSFIAGAPLTDESGTAFTLHTELTTGLTADDMVAISDCGTTKIFAMDAASVGDTDLALSGSNYCAYVRFRKGASLRRLTTVYYFVATSVSGNTTSLYRQAGEGVAAEELLEGVENLQVEFGVDTDGDNQIDDWDTADNITAAMWNGWDYNSDPDGNPATADGVKDNEIVRAVRYSLLFVTEDAVLGEPQSLVYNGTALPDAGDGRLRQVFTSSVGIRSRIK